MSDASLMVEPGRSFIELESYAVEVAVLAAEAIATSIDTTLVRTKSTEADIVTAADVAAEALILDRLSALTPGARVLGEESGGGSLGSGPWSNVEWVVDPLDGTVNFSYSIPITSVSVAAVVEGRVVAGAVVDIASREVFSAARGKGARKDDRPVQCNRAERLDLCLLATGYPYSAPLRAKHGQTIADLLGKVRDVRAFGSAALQLCWVASGRVDAYLERHTKPWDYAAGSLIAEEAGAKVELPCPENSQLTLAVHPKHFSALRALA